MAGIVVVAVVRLRGSAEERIRQSSDGSPAPRPWRWARLARLQHRRPEGERRVPQQRLELLPSLRRQTPHAAVATNI